MREEPELTIPFAIVLFGAGLGLVIYFAEKLVKGTVGASAGFGVSAFLISVLFIGCDPENLSVGAVGSYQAGSERDQKTDQKTGQNDL